MTQTMYHATHNTIAALQRKLDRCHRMIEYYGVYDQPLRYRVRMLMDAIEIRTEKGWK
jgi:hypothetical protein